MNMTRHRTLLAAVLAAVSVTAVACRDAAPETTPSEGPSVTVTDVDPDRSKDIEATVEARASGAVEFTWTGRELMSITRVGGLGLQVNVLSTGFQNPILLPENPRNRFRWAFDLGNAYDDRPGTYTLKTASTAGEEAADYAVLVWLRVKDGSKPAVFDMSEVDELEEFNEMRQPCTLELGADLLSGSLSCPELASASGKTVAMRVRWSDGTVVPAEDSPEDEAP